MRRRHRLAVLAAAWLCCGPSSGCATYGRWGPQRGTADFSESAECWEGPLGGLIALPLAVFEASLSLVATVGVNLLVWPVSAGAVASGDVRPPVVWIFPGTVIALTLLDPDCNLDFSQGPPKHVVGISWFKRV